jgi:hypothetical protein
VQVLEQYLRLCTCTPVYCCLHRFDPDLCRIGVQDWPGTAKSGFGIWEARFEVLPESP